MESRAEHLPAAEFDDEIEFRRMIRAIEIAEKYYLYFACCTARKQNEIIERARQSLAPRLISIIIFDRPIDNLLQELELRLPDEKVSAIFVNGLEHSITSAGKGKDNPLIINLNLTRDAFPQKLSCPLILCLPEYALVKIINNAPDFFSVRSGLFYFSLSPEGVAEQISFHDAGEYFETASLTAEVKQNRLRTLLQLLQEYQALPTEKRDRPAELRLLRQIANTYFALSDYYKAEEYYEQALAAACNIGNRASEGRQLGSLGSVYWTLGNYRRAQDYYEQALSIARETGNRVYEGGQLGNLGSVYGRSGDYNRAQEYFEQALAVARESGDRNREGRHLGNLGIVYSNLFNNHKAQEYFEQALAIAREIGNRVYESGWLGNLGNVFISLGNYRTAEKYYEQALAIARDTGDRNSERIWLGNLGYFYRSIAAYRKAQEYFEQALSIARDIGDRKSEARHLVDLSTISLDIANRKARIVERERWEREREAWWDQTI